MFKIFKSRDAKAALSSAIIFALVFSMMISLVSAAVPDIIISVDQEPTVNADAIAPAPMPTVDPIRTLPAEGANLEEGLREALIAVKLYFDVDEDKFTEFNWYFMPGDGVYNPDSWVLSWNSSDWSANINAQVTAGGILLYYYKHEWTDDSNRRNITLARVSKSRARRTADEFLQKVLGDDAGKFRLADQTLGFPSDRHRLNYVLTHNGFDYPNYNISVELDKLTGEILGYSRGGHQFFHDLSEDIFEYQDAGATIAKDKALESYLEHIGLDLVYTSQYDWQARELKVHPVYRLKNNRDEFISAVDGSLVKIDFNIQPIAGMAGGYAEAEMVAEDSGSPARNISFSPAEQAALDSAGDYITADQAVAAMIKAFDLELDLSEYQVNSGLRVDQINQEQYLWNISLIRRSDTGRDWIGASVDARNSNIINFSQSSAYYNEIIMDDGSGRIMRGYVEPEPIYTYDEAKELVLKKIKEILPYDLDENFELVDTRYYSRIVPVAEGGDAAKDASYQFYYVRKVNGIHFESNSVSIMFNNITGMISNYDLTWYENAEFPALDNIISSARALSRIEEYAGYNINYMSNGMTDDGKINVSLVYTFGNSVNIDPFTGNWIGRNFEEITREDALPPSYRDLEGHWSKDIVDTLTANDIYVWGGRSFDPDKDITKGEFLSYLRFYSNNIWLFTGLETSIFVDSRAFIRNESLGEDADNIISRQEAAQIICEIAGYGQLGSRHEIFAYPFDDEGSDEQYRGYIAIMKALGIIQGDGSGNYNAKSNLTRAEAASLVYNIIMAFQ